MQSFCFLSNGPTSLFYYVLLINRCLQNRMSLCTWDLATFVKIFQSEKFSFHKKFVYLIIKVSIVGSVVECSPATRAARVRFPDDANIFFVCQLCLGQNCSGGAGYRSRYLSHAKRALYHLSYAPRWSSSDWPLFKLRTDGCFVVWMIRTVL